jgi:hypothetical protein
MKLASLSVAIVGVAMSTQTLSAHGNGLWTKCKRDSDCNGGRQCLPDSKGKTWRCRTKIGGDDHDVMYDWDLCDQCDPNNPSVAGKLCKPNTADVCNASPCDSANTLVNNRGWWCTSGTSKVIVFSSSARAFEDGRATVIEAAYPAGSSPGAAVIPFKFGYPCSACGANWCEPGTATRCGPCAPCPAGSAFAARGWLCHKDTDSVCTNEHGMAILDSDFFFGPEHFDTKSLTLKTTIPASSIGAQLHKVSCKDSPACVWGITAATILVVALTAGTVGGVLAAGEAAAEAGEAAAELALAEAAADAAADEEMAAALAERAALQAERATFQAELELIEANGRVDGAWTAQYVDYYARSLANAIRIEQAEAAVGIRDIVIVAPGAAVPARRRLRALAGGSGKPGYNNVKISIQQMA